MRCGEMWRRGREGRGELLMKARREAVMAGEAAGVLVSVEC